MLKNLEADERHDAGNSKDQGEQERDYEEFMQEIEGDKEMRANVRLFKKQQATGADAGKKKVAAGGKGMEQEEGGSEDDAELDDEEVRLDELLDELTLAGSEHADLEATSKIVTAEEAAQAPAISLEGSGFDAANFAEKDFKFV